MSAFSAHGQLVINEVCSSNKTLLVDEFGLYPDWIELYNNGPLAMELEDHYLTDSPTDTFRWELPDTLLPAGAYLIIFASARDTADSEFHTNFKLDQQGEAIWLYDENGVLVDSVDTPSLEADDSYGRVPNGTGDFFFFDDPTGDTVNYTTSYLGYADPPLFSHDGGFYNGGFTVTLTNPNIGGDMYFTLDGNFPSDTSTLYSVPIQITGSTNLSAMCTVPQHINSEIDVNSYLINKPNHHLPVISITTAPGLLWSDSAGIYVTGDSADTEYPFFGANFWQDWEIPAHVEYYTVEDEQFFEQRFGMKIHGGTVSRTRAQKSFRFLARDEYGDGDLDVALFPNRGANNIKRFVLRNAGGDFGYGHCRDGIANKLVVEDGLDVDAGDYQPVVVYLNTEYWGILNLREKMDRYYPQQNYNIDADSLDLIEEDTILLQGSIADFDTLYNYVLTEDMSDSVNFDSVAARLDMNSYTDYFITELFHNNLDWPHNNLKMWRAHAPGSKWRYFLFDLDGAYYYRGWVEPEFDFLDSLLNDYGVGKRHAEIFKALVDNEDYKEYFITRYADLLNTTFSSYRMNEALQEQIATVAHDMPDHLEKWEIPYETYNFEVDDRIPYWMDVRPDLVRTHIETQFDLEKQVTLHLNVYPPGSGTIEVNTIHPQEFPWEGIYFDGVPVELTAVPGPGFQFHHWEALNSFEQTTAQTVKRNYTSGDDITAHFATYLTPFNLSVYPNPATDELMISFVLDSIQEVDISMVNALGQRVEKLNTFELNAGRNNIRLDLSEVEKGIYFVNVRTDEINETSKVFVKK